MPVQDFLTLRKADRSNENDTIIFFIINKAGNNDEWEIWMNEISEIQ